MSIESQIQFIVEKNMKQRVNDAERIMKGVVHIKSGALHDSIRQHRVKKGHYWVGVDVNKLKADPRNIGRISYAPMYRFGVKKPYVIRPKKANVLRWFGEDGKPRFAKYVTIPARPGHDFIQETLRKLPRR